MAYDINKLPRLKHLRDLAERLKTQVTALEDRVDELVTEGGEPNVIETVKVNGTALTVTDKSVDITVPTKTSDLTNDSGYQTDDDVDNAIKSQIGSAYQAGGSVDPDNLPELTDENVGLVVNVTDPFITDADFLEGAGNEYPSGTNIVIVKQGDDIKYDVLSGFVDLSNYVTKDELPEPYVLPVASSQVLGGIKVPVMDTNSGASGKQQTIFRWADSEFLRLFIDYATKDSAGLSQAGDGIKLGNNGKFNVDIATDAEVTEMLDSIFPVSP